MNPQHLSLFSNDKHVKESVRQYIEAFIDDYALDKVYKKEDVTGIADARDVLRKAFEQIDIDYGAKEKPKEKDPNPAA